MWARRTRRSMWLALDVLDSSIECIDEGRPAESSRSTYDPLHDVGQ
jgi:hypothetical protein